MEDVIIIGSGCAGLTAALYTARARLSTLVITGNELGGQIATTTDVENYPGFPEGLTGPELYEHMQKQAERFGARLEFDEVTEVDFRQRPFKLKTHGGSFEARAVIVASGASPRKLGIPGEAEFLGRGVSYCATCDGFFFRDKEIMVVGGGDSALQEGLFLTRFGKRVRVVHRRDALRAGPALQTRAAKNDKMEFVYDTVVEQVIGNNLANAVQLKNVQTGQVREEPVDGLFIYIGHIPNTWLYEGQLDMDEEGYLIVDERLHTNLPGVFAAGEVHDKIFRQAITSAGYGCMAALEAEQYLSELE
jgi:thioredoxin reductase (NADPH)